MTDVDLTDTSLILLAVVPAVVFGLMTALIARSKGRSFIGWWLYGTFTPPFALFYAMFMAPKRHRPGKRGASSGAQRRCPYCGEAVKPDLDVCPECWRVLPADEITP